MDQIKLRKLNFEYLESMTNASTTYMLMQSPIEQLPLVVTRRLILWESPNAILTNKQTVESSGEWTS